MNVPWSLVAIRDHGHAGKAFILFNITHYYNPIITPLE